MPKIRPINSEITAGGLPPAQQASPSDFGGTGVSEFGQHLGVLGERMEQQAEIDDVSNVRVKMAQARAEWETHFRDEAASADPNDPNFSGKFKQSFADYLGKTREIAQTKKGQQTFDILAAEMGSQFSEKADVFQAAQAGQKAKLNYTTSLNAYASSIVTDPTSYGQVKAQFNAELNDPNGIYSDKRIGKNARDELIIKGNEQLAQSYVNGLIDNGAPELARRLLIDGKLDSEISGDMKQTLISAADSGINAKETAATHAAAAAKKAEGERVDKINNDLMGEFTSGTLNVAKVRKAGLPAFGEGSQATWINMLKAQTKEWQDKPVRTNPTVMRDLYERINLPNGDPRKITDLKPVNDAYLNQQLSTADMEHASRWVTDAKSDSGQKLGQAQSQFLSGMKGSITKSTLNKLDAEGDQRFYQYQSYVDGKVQEARDKKEDPYELFNPNSPKYLGKSVRSFQTGAQHMQSDLSSKVNDALGKKPQRQPGETPAQYLERTGGK